MSNLRAYSHKNCPRCRKPFFSMGEQCKCRGCGAFDLQDLVMAERGLIDLDDVMTVHEKTVFAKNLGLQMEDFLE